jgi:hypothetical protein
MMPTQASTLVGTSPPGPALSLSYTNREPTSLAAICTNPVDTGAEQRWYHVAEGTGFLCLAALYAVAKGNATSHALWVYRRTPMHFGCTGVRGPAYRQDCKDAGMHDESKPGSVGVQSEQVASISLKEPV